MNRQKPKRKRGVVLTVDGYKKLQDARLDLEIRENQGEKYTLEELSGCTGLDHTTIKKVLEREEGVDRRTLERFFTGFGLVLDKNDYSRPITALEKSESSVIYKCKDSEPEVDITVFYGRTEELARLRQWLLQDRCRLIALLGIGGIGKTSLAVKLVEQVKNNFEYVIWRSLQDAPSVHDTLSDLLQFLSDVRETEADLSGSQGDKVSRLISHLRMHRCLLILDNVESILCSGRRAGEYREGCEGYSELLKRVGEASHRSCLLLTSREKPKEVASLEGEGLAVRSLRLSGLNQTEGQAIFRVKGLSGSTEEIRALVKHYAGNALALKIVATTIQDLFDGKIAEFLKQETTVFGDIRDLLDQQFDRLTPLEKDIMYWLAINREPVSLSQLQDDIVSPIPSQRLLEALESLGRRSLIEKHTLLEKHTMLFTLQPVVMEYVTNQIIEYVCEEIVTQNLDLFRCHALIKATAKHYVRETQVRLILQPLVDELLTSLRSTRRIEAHLVQILEDLRATSPLETGYTAGNILNLLCHLRIDLTGYDFSHLTIWQADLRNVKLHRTNFAHTNIEKSVFAETFGSVFSVAFSPNGKLLAAGDSNGEIRIRRVADGQQILTLKGHTNWVLSLSFSPDSKTLASSSVDCTVRVWSINTGNCLYVLQEHDNEVWSVTFNPNGSLLASGSDDHTIRLWCVSTGKCLRVFQGHANWVLSVAFSVDGTLIASGSDDDTIRLWDVNTEECLRIFRGHLDGIRSIAFDSQNTVLASGSDDNTIRLWNVNTGKCLKILQGHSNGVWSVAFSLQSKTLVSGSLDQTVKLWNINTGQCLKTFHGHRNWVCSVAFNPQGDTVASGSRDQAVRLWNINTGQCLRVFQGYTNQFLSVAFSPDGKTLSSGSHDHMVRLWNSSTGKILNIFPGHTNWVYSVAFNPQGDTLASGSGDQTVKLWDVRTGRYLKTLEGHHAAIRSVTFCPDGQTIASGSDDQTIRIWDISTGQILRTLEGHYAPIWSLNFNPQGTLLVSSSLEQIVKIWDVKTGECKETLEGHTSWAWGTAFSPDGEILASTSADRTLRLWRVSTGECLRVVQLESTWLQCVTFSPDGQVIATGCQDFTIRLWNIRTGECIKTLQGHTGWVWSVSFCSDHETLASSSEDENIRLWNIRTGECFKVLKVENPYEQMNIAGITGLTEAEIATLKSLGAVD